MIPVGPILSIPFDGFFYISLHYIPSHMSFLHLHRACNYPWTHRENSLCAIRDVLSVVNICLIHFLIQRVRGPFGILTFRLSSALHALCPGFFFCCILSLQLGFVAGYIYDGRWGKWVREERHNKSQSTEMKINDPAELQIRSETQKCLWQKEKVLQRLFVQMYWNTQISGITFMYNVYFRVGDCFSLRDSLCVTGARCWKITTEEHLDSVCIVVFTPISGTPVSSNKVVEGCSSFVASDAF